MTPTPPSSSEGSSLPPRSRPNLDAFLKDSHETDLWAFDDLDSVEESSVKSPTRLSSSSLPSPRQPSSTQPTDPDNPAAETEMQTTDSVRVNIGKTPSRTRGGSMGNTTALRTDVNDLDDWDQPAHQPPALEIHSSFISGAAAASTDVQERNDVQTPAQEALPTPPLPATAQETEIDELSPLTRENATPISLIPRLGLSKIECLGVWALVIALLVGGSLIFLSISQRLPTDNGLAKTGDFPIKGRHTEIVAAETFWRAPITQGENAETFRRGIQLLPVIHLTSKGAPAAVRVFFRNQDGVVMGDAVTRTIRPGTPLQVAATTGFEDIGMHAAYRTGQSKPWSIEVREAPAETSPNADFIKLFETEVSTDRR